MKKTVYLLFSLFCFGIQAQEVILEPSFVKQKPFVLKSTEIKAVQLNDTLNLPFIDDFSTNKLAPIISSSQTGQYTLVKQYQYISINNSINFPKTYSTDTSFTTIFTLTDTLKTANLPVDTLLKYNFSEYPAVFVDSIAVWNFYDLVDSLNNGVFDTVKTSFESNDSASFAEFPVKNNFWVDNLAMINSQYALNLPSIGCATLDAVNHYGDLYNQASTATFPADSLTSKCIDLSNLNPSDLLYLSFMVEQKGLGDLPENKDLLTVQFKDSLGTWNTVWLSSEQPEISETEFSNIYLALNDSIYFFKGFQFRFLNYASLNTLGGTWQSNVDHWHLDYVILDKNRSENDNYIQDVCFQTPPSTLINGYQSIPWKHYANNTTLTQSSSSANVNNIGLLSANVNFDTKISENSSLIFQSAGGNSANVAANGTTSFTQNYAAFVFASSEINTAEFEVKYQLSSDISDLIPGNDSARYQQVFDAYYAYDDGSAEAGYGLNSTYGKFAYNFPLLVTTDTLTAFDVYFNNTASGENNSIPLILKVWKNNNGVPGDELFSNQVVTPKQSDSLNRFISYKLDEKLILSENIFIGWEQQSDKFVNIGLDRNSNNSAKMFFKVNEENSAWQASAVSGSVMLRPRFGSLSFLSAEELNQASIVAYPNPTSNLIRMDNLPLFSKILVRDIVGKIVEEQNNTSESNTLSLAHLPQGIYLITVVSQDGKILGYQKIIKQN